MCDDSRAEKQYWMRRVDELRRQVEREDLERQRDMAPPPGTAAGSVEPRPLGVSSARGRWGSIVALVQKLCPPTGPERSRLRRRDLHRLRLVVDDHR
jgi:hypothetical protein